MIEIKNIVKKYQTGDLLQVALDNVTINFRNSGFVGILGPSGSGKTTLLNIIGGLEKYDNGELIVDGVSTFNYSEDDFNYYRNHNIGYIFQNYNLIAHQSILRNIELALTISGLSAKESKERSLKALEMVGLRDQYRKKPSQLSGGQQQRVAIARALVNNPSIILADEPTGSLDSETSIQIMELLKELAKDKLVIMVSHNEELINKYATRTIVIKDGCIVKDSNPYFVDHKIETKNKKGKTKTPLITSFLLSFSNLLTKKGRTIMVSLAQSIGIIGIALVLSFSSGLSNYADYIQKDVMADNPLVIKSELSNILMPILNATVGDKNESAEGVLYEKLVISKIFNKANRNDLKSFLNYLYDNCDLRSMGVSGLDCKYSISPLIYTKDISGDIVELNPESVLSYIYSKETLSMINNISTSFTTDTYKEVDYDDLTQNTTIIAGRYPSEYNELAVVLSQKASISDLLIYSLGLRSNKELKTLINEVVNNDEVSVYNKPKVYGYDEIQAVDLRLVNPDDLYEYKDGYYALKDDLENIYENSEKIKIVGILYAPDVLSNMTGIVYLPSLTDYIMSNGEESPLVNQQLENTDIDIFTGKPFDTDNSLNNNLQKLNYQPIDEPTTLTFYFNDYNSKEKFTKLIEDYNGEVEYDQIIAYSDNGNTLIDYTKNIINEFSGLLIIIIVVSMFVSFVMIVIVTLMSVTERKKEIGILRAIGASKSAIVSIFSFETFIIGLLSGLIGILVSYLSIGFINNVIYDFIGTNNLKATLDTNTALILAICSIILSMIAGFIPSLKAAKKDPASSLRSE